MNYKTSTKTGYYVGNAAAAFMIFFGGLLVVCLMAPEARMAGQFYSGAYGLSFLMALAPIIGGILIIRRNMRRLKSMNPGGPDSFSGQRQQMHAIVYCPSCGQKLRLPAGKGRMEITCPRCRKNFRNFT